MDNKIPTFAPEIATTDEPVNPLDHARIAKFMQDVARGGERLVKKVSADINEISIRRAMQIGYMLACQDNNIEVPDMEDPAKALGYGNV